MKKRLNKSKIFKNLKKRPEKKLKESKIQRVAMLNFFQ